MSDESTGESLGAVGVARWMEEGDRFAQQLGIQVLEATPGGCVTQMLVTKNMLNAVGVTHGGALYTLADFAFAVACNTRERVAVALSTSMVYTAASTDGDTLTAKAVERSCGHRTASYDIEVTTQSGAVVGLFNGVAYRKSVSVAQFLQQGEG